MSVHTDTPRRILTERCAEKFLGRLGSWTLDLTVDTYHTHIHTDTQTHRYAQTSYGPSMFQKYPWANTHPPHDTHALTDMARQILTDRCSKRILGHLGSWTLELALDSSPKYTHTHSHTDTQPHKYAPTDVDRSCGCSSVFVQGLF